MNFEAFLYNRKEKIVRLSIVNSIFGTFSRIVTGDFSTTSFSSKDYSAPAVHPIRKYKFQSTYNGVEGTVKFSLTVLSQEVELFSSTKKKKSNITMLTQNKPKISNHLSYEYTSYQFLRSNATSLNSFRRTSCLLLARLTPTKTRNYSLLSHLDLRRI